MPEAFRFSGSEAIIGSASHEAQDIINHFKNWLPLANRVYADKIDREQKETERREKEALKQQIAKEEEKAKINMNLKF